MSLNFTPKTEEELNKSVLLQKGEYDFEVMKAEEALSKSGNDMIKLTLKVYGPNGETAHVYDYLLVAMEFKLKHFCDSVGLVAEYESGQLTADMCGGRAGRCKLAVETDASGKYDDKNVVKDYVASFGPVPADDTPF